MSTFSAVVLGGLELMSMFCATILMLVIVVIGLLTWAVHSSKKAEKEASEAKSQATDD